MQKYNLALIPASCGNEVIRYANQFAWLADKYLLGVNSLPHVTLYQFEADKIEDVWKKAKSVWKENSILLNFYKFSCVSFDNYIFWTSLLPDHGDELLRMHRLIAEVLGKPVKENFEPHMTLFNTKNKDYEKEVNELKKSYQPIFDKFVLSLGKCDAIGQLTEIIFISTPELLNWKTNMPRLGETS